MLCMHVFCKKLGSGVCMGPGLGSSRAAHVYRIFICGSRFKKKCIYCVYCNLRCKQQRTPSPKPPPLKQQGVVFHAQNTFCRFCSIWSTQEVKSCSLRRKTSLVKYLCSNILQRFYSEVKEMSVIGFCGI